MRVESPIPSAPVARVAIVTLDSHLGAAVGRAQGELAREGVELSLHAASEWAGLPSALDRCKDAVAQADVVIVSMMFLDEHIQAIKPTLEARRADCKAMVSIMSSAEVVKLTRLGRLDMSVEQTGPLALLKRLRGKPKPGGGSSGAGQMKMLRRLPKILKWIPGKAQDLRAYFLTMQYFLAGSDENVANMARFLAGRYGGAKPAPVGEPLDYPEVGVYHPRLPTRMAEDDADLPKGGATGTVGLLVMRSYVLSGDARHYDGAIAAFEARGMRVIPAFAAGLDARPAVEKYFIKDGKPVVDAVVSLTGFSLVGGPAYNDSQAAEALLTKLDVPYVAAHALEFQTLEQWRDGARGLTPVEATIMVAIPEIDGATGPTVFGGRSGSADGICHGCGRSCDFSGGASARDMNVCAERAERLALRVEKMIRLRRAKRSERRIAVTLFNFPPNAGATGTAAYLSVFESLHRTLGALRDAGYSVEVPATVDGLRDAVLKGNAEMLGQDANVHAKVPADVHVRREPYLAEIERAWGPAPGKQLTNGRDLYILGAQFGNVFVGVQPGFGYEGDPMRLLFERGFAPTHAFSAYYRWLREDFDAHAVLHFGTHGALEFMPGKQTGLAAEDWPDRLIGDLPNLYLYAANNPSEGALAKRRANATLISYMTPPLAAAGLYRGLLDLKATLERWRAAPPEAVQERAELAELIQAQASAVDLSAAEPAWADPGAECSAMANRILEVEYALIPHGLHIVGKPPCAEARTDMLVAVAEAAHNAHPAREAVAAVVAGATPEAAAKLGGDIAVLQQLADMDKLLSQDFEIPALIAALDGRFIRPAPGGDILRAPEVLPTGRNLHGFDPFRIPSAYAMADGARQAARLLARHMQDGAAMPKTVAIVLWGADNLKSEGAQVAQALALMGAAPRIDGYGRVCGARLLPLAELGRPRVDVMATLSGIFRDLLPIQTRMLAEAAWLAATADEPAEMNHVRANALEHMARTGCDMETASLRVFSNADGAYGANVNLLVDSSAWEHEDELADAYSKRKCFAYGRDGVAKAQPDLLQSIMKGVDLAYQNLESVELGVTTIDHYFDTLGGISRSVKRARGGEGAPTYIGDQTRGEGQVRTLSEQVALETRTRTLNPKWYEGMLNHGHEGVRQIEAQVTNAFGWSATTGEVDPWVYQRTAETFVLDEQMRRRLAALNPKASARMANRLIEACERNYWTPDPETLEALRRAGDELEDALEGVSMAAE